MSPTIELQCRLKSNLIFNISLGQRLVVLLLGDVQIVHVGRVVLAVVQLHDLRVNVRLQRAIVVRQVREAVLVPGARGTGRGAQSSARAERDREDAASCHRHREPATSAAETNQRGTPRPRALPLTCTPPDTTLLRRPRPLLSSEHGRSLAAARLLCGVRPASARTQLGADPAGSAHQRRGGPRHGRPSL